MPDEPLHDRRPRGQRDPTIRALDFHPSPTPPVSERDLEWYAGRWVAVCDGRVVLEAPTYDTLVATCASRPSRSRETIRHLPPTAAS
jgi:hypothetical protein